MINNLPSYIPLIFVMTTALTLTLFMWCIWKSKSRSTQKAIIWTFIGLSIWLFLQAFLSWNHVYSSDTNSFPPKIMLFGILPTFIGIAVLFTTDKGRKFIDSLPLRQLTYLSIVRIPVEIILWWLFLQKTIPAIMTFEGLNFDILAGITAPVIAYFGLTKTIINRKVVFIWNVISLCLLINIIFIALLAAPTPIQKLAFDQPNIALFHFPFSWLPTFIVPIVIFSHLVSIRKLKKRP